MTWLLWSGLVLGAAALSYVTQFSGATLFMGKALSDGDTGRGFQDAITPPWQTNLALLVYFSLVAVVGLMETWMGIGCAGHRRRVSACTCAPALFATTRQSALSAVDCSLNGKPIRGLRTRRRHRSGGGHEGAATTGGCRPRCRAECITSESRSCPSGTRLAKATRFCSRLIRDVSCPKFDVYPGVWRAQVLAFRAHFR
jgi:hypothetical protein